MTQATKRRLDLLLLGLVSLALILSGVAGYIGQHLAGRQQTCLTFYANELADALEARNKAVGPREEAQAEVFRVVFQLQQGRGTREDFERALRAYVVADDKLTKERAANPYPAPPREVCPRG